MIAGKFFDETLARVIGLVCTRARWWSQITSYLKVDRHVVCL